MSQLCPHCPTHFAVPSSEPFSADLSKSSGSSAVPNRVVSPYNVDHFMVLFSPATWLYLHIGLSWAHDMLAIIAVDQLYSFRFCHLMHHRASVLHHSRNALLVAHSALGTPTFKILSQTIIMIQYYYALTLVS